MQSVLSIDQIRRLLRAVQDRFEVSDTCGIALEGSLAEGLGNSSSDVDFLVIADEEFDFPVIPTLLFIDGYRVEVRTRSASEMKRQLAKVAEAARRGKRSIRQLDEEDLDRCQRFLSAIDVQNEAYLSSVRRFLPRSVLDGVIATWLSEQARDSLHCAVAMDTLGLPASAVSWAQSALTEAAKSWLARKGDCYLAKKWLSEQLTRTAPGDELTNSILELETLARSGLEPRDYLERVFEILRRLGLAGKDFDGRNLVLEKAAHVTTWQLGERVHLLRNKTELFALSAQAADTWRSLRFGGSLLELIDGGERRSEQGSVISQFHGLGLVEIAWRGAGVIRRRKTTNLPPYIQWPVLSPDGLIVGDDAPSIVLSALPPSRFAAAGMALLYVNMVIENAREDALGAMDGAQWRVFERSVKRMLRFACFAMLSSYGINPLPPVEEVYGIVEELKQAPPALRAHIIEFERTLRIEDKQSALSALRRMDAIASEMRQNTKGSVFPSSFESASGWQQTLNMGFDWARLGAFLDAKFPLEQARDLIQSGKTARPIVKQPADRSGARGLPS
ncbi:MULTISPECIES: nucleotidyltransferase domain-containing protein [unclassified Bradyrhizobium]|uniref:nucleotidyltransferase domain-containing protein n=1 Tax=unclassified Bradyrhizobium TaxID=2631580 RepID=UPI0028EB8F74|nr:MULTISPECIES: nucleotidyltransferase domain-containing protein [unclassified Bradyrhizobium]